MEFTTLDYHIMKLLAGNLRVTEHVMKSRLQGSINNRTHLLFRVNRLVEAGLIRTQDGISYGLSVFGKIIMGSAIPTEEQKALLRGKGIPLRLSLEAIENNHKAAAAAKAATAKQQAQDKPKVESADIRAVSGTRASKIATSQLTSLLDRVKRQTPPPAKRAMATTPTDQAKPATPDASTAPVKTVSPVQPETAEAAKETAKSVGQEKSAKPDTSTAPVKTASPVQPETTEVAKETANDSNHVKGYDTMQLTEIKNADIYCLTDAESLAIQLVHAMQPITASRIKETSLLRNEGINSIELTHAINVLVHRKILRQDNDARLSLVEGAAFALGMGDDAPRREHNETAIFSLTRAERMVVEMAMQHKVFLVALRNIPQMLERCGESHMGMDVDKLVSGLIDKKAVEIKQNKSYYLTNLLLLAAGAKRYSAKRHSEDIAAFSDPSAFDFLIKGTSAPAAVKKAPAKTQVPAASAKSVEKDVKDAQSEPPTSRAASQSPAPTSPTVSSSSNAEADNLSKKSEIMTQTETPEAQLNIDAELEEMKKKLSAPDIQVQDLDAKLKLLDAISAMLPEGAKGSRSLLDGIMADLKKMA